MAPDTLTVPGPKIARANANALPFRTGIARTAVFSSPYYGRRSYGASTAERGTEPLYEFCRAIVRDMREVWRVLADDGTCWFNIGDTAVSGGSGGDYYNPGGSKASHNKYRQGTPTVGLPVEVAAVSLFDNLATVSDGWRHDYRRLPGGNWLLVPHHVAMHLQGDGWVLRKEIVWEKGTSKPEDPKHTRRPGESHETILFLSKSMNYQFHPDRLPRRRVTDPAVLDALPAGSTVTIAKAKLGRVKGVAPPHLPTGLWHGTDPFGRPVAETSADLTRYDGGVMLPLNEAGSVWHIKPGRSEADGHPAVFPNALAERCIELSSEPGDIILDPYVGSGTTIAAAERLGRIGIGTDLYAGDWGTA